MPNLSALRIVLCLWLAGLCAAAQFAKFGLFLPELQRLYPDSGTELGFLVSLVSVVGALLGLFAGALTGRVGLRKVLLAGLTLGSVLSLVQALHLPMSVLLATRILEGVSHLAIVVSAPTLMALHSSERLRASAMTLWGTFFGVSFAITAWFGSPLVTTHGIQALLMVHGLLIGATALLVRYILPAQVLRSAATPASGWTVTPRSFVLQHTRAWLSPAVAAPAAGWLFYTITFVALLVILPGLLPPDERSLIAALLPLASIAASMTLGIALLQRYTAVQVLIIGFASATCFAMFIPIAPDAAIAYLLLFAALGLVQGASFAAIPQLNVTGEKQGLANGTLAQAGNIGNLCGTPLLFMLHGYGGVKAVVVAVVICYVAAIAVHLICARRRAME